MKPGQQAQIQNGHLIVKESVAIDEVISWKEGSFLCEDASVDEVMRQISRWYDVNIVYQQHVNKHVSLLNVPRSVTLTQILKIMEMTGNVKFLIEGKKVTVMAP